MPSTNKNKRQLTRLLEGCRVVAASAGLIGAATLVGRAAPVLFDEDKTYDAMFNGNCQSTDPTASTDQCAQWGQEHHHDAAVVSELGGRALTFFGVDGAVICLATIAVRRVRGSETGPTAVCSEADSFQFWESQFESSRPDTE